MRAKEKMQNKISEVSNSNKKIQAQKKELQSKVESFQFANQKMEASNQELRNLLAMQNERLEKIEQIALSNPKEEKTAIYFFNLSNLRFNLRT